ncbi:beta-aspartyl-peptidase [Vibrio sp. SS-MA-C1-2]|uniref:beta-aspartyl-peptidase n=1 Tax=Vibrio sp. SS-MA-C1-2 TaxID=2908646 RepID=UPI001F1919CF|nr:beta-aspartyl-peptidase [Vibrio sp. SS-MA-C1-2]UJF18454.1 beta-aspartyl-peptidase [Vibrio sp. SS-MA-C1-2]
MQTLIKNAEVYAPSYQGKQDVLVAGGKIIAIEASINGDQLYGDVNIINGEGKYLTPGFIDTHQHFIGGGGEGGFSTRTPELVLSDQTLNGVTTALGLLGTDHLSRHVETLFAKTMGFRDEGLSAYMITGSYFLPSPTITGGVMSDIAYIEPVVGVKLAVSDHRGPYITDEKVRDLTAEVRNAALVSNKAGIITVHTGAGKAGLSQILKVVEETDYHAGIFVPTHINRADVWEQAVQLAKLGSVIDGTALSDDMMQRTGAISCAKATQISIELGFENNFTFSSDAGGSLPKWNQERTKVLSMGVGKPNNLLIEVKRGMNELGLTLDQMLKPITVNASKQLGLSDFKGEIKTGFDADMLLIDKEAMTIDYTWCKGKLMVEAGVATVKGMFEG